MMTIIPSIFETITRVYAFDVSVDQVKAALTSVALQNIPGVDPHRVSSVVELSTDGARITLTEAVELVAAPAPADLRPPSVEDVAQVTAAPVGTPAEPSFIPWTEAEVETVIALARDMPGATKTAIAKAAEAQLPGRGWRAILQQLHRKLADRIATAMEEAGDAAAPNSKPAPIQDPAPIEAPTPKPAPIAKAPAPASTAPGPRPVWWRPTEILVDSLSNKGGWTRAEDLALVEARMRGDDWILIADALGRERGSIRQRWVALTPDGDKGLHLDHLAQVLRHRIEVGK